MAETTATMRDGARLRVFVDGEGPDLFLVSGLGGTAAFWQPLLSHLTDAYRVIRIDQRGIGASEKGALACTIDVLAEDCLEVLVALGSAAAAVVGHSTGGAIAQTMALARQDMVRALGLSSTWARPDRYMRELFHLRSLLLRMNPGAYAAHGFLVAHPTDWLACRWDLFDAAVAAAPATDGQRRVMEDRISALLAFDRSDELAFLACPTLILGTADDAIVPLPLQEELQSLIPGSRLERFPWGGHFTPMTVTSAYAATLRSWLDETYLAGS